MSSLTVTGHRKGTFVRAGIVVGIVAGTAFILTEMFFAHMLGNSLLTPLRLISTIVLGTQAMLRDYNAIASLAIGVLVHYALSILFGVISAAIFALVIRRGGGGAGPREFVVLGFLDGMVVWIVDFYLIAPRWFPQFAQLNPFWNGFVAHAIFGVVLGLGFAANANRRARAIVPH